MTGCDWMHNLGTSDMRCVVMRCVHMRCVHSTLIGESMGVPRMSESKGNQIVYIPTQLQAYSYTGTNVTVATACRSYPPDQLI